MADNVRDAISVSVSGPVGIGKESLQDLLNRAFGENAGSITSVRIGYFDKTHFDTKNFNYWDPANPVVTTVLDHGKPMAGSHFNTDGSRVINNPTIDAAHFQDIQISIGNSIFSNVFLEVAETTASGDTVWRDLTVTTIPHQLTTHGPSDHAPTAADIVQTAKFFANVERGTFNNNDCHNIATAIAASAGATFDPNTGDTANPDNNEEGGFWRIAYRGTNSNAVADWQSKVQAGDIVRMERNDGGVHTVTVTAGLNADGKHFGQIQVVDNMDSATKDHIGEHWVDYDNNTKTGSITIYRLTTDDKYLIDQSKDTHDTTILGTTFNDQIMGGAGDNTLRGAEGNDDLFGGAGKDILDGGSGADSMFGGSGDDTYIVDSAKDVVNEIRLLGPGGIDTVKTRLSSYSLDTHENSHIKGNVENLTFTGFGSHTGHGNGLDNEIRGAFLGKNTLFGADGADRLFGGRNDDVLDGGTGADWMVGGGGNDKYFVDSRGDTVVEEEFVTDPVTGRVTRRDPGGIDEIVTTLNKFSVDNARGNIENLTFNGTGDFEGRGNQLDNQITGGAGNDHLFGNGGVDKLLGGAGNDTLDGGTGADTMRGGSGNDTYIVDNAGDVVDDTLRRGAHLIKDGGGIDEVRTTLSDYTLSSSNPASNDFRGVIENLTYTGSGKFEGHGNGVANVITGGDHADKLFGNGGADTLFGGAGNDSLFGGTGKDTLIGGVGADKLTGGADVDKFVFALGDNGVTAKTADHITDFAKGETLDVSDFVASHKTIETTKNFHGNISEALSFAKDHIADGNGFAGSAVLTDSSSHNVYVLLDQDGDHKFESAIVLDHADALKGDLHTEIMSHQLFV